MKLRGSHDQWGTRSNLDLGAASIPAALCLTPSTAKTMALAKLCRGQEMVNGQAGLRMDEVSSRQISVFPRWGLSADECILQIGRPGQAPAPQRSHTVLLGDILTLQVATLFCPPGSRQGQCIVVVGGNRQGTEASPGSSVHFPSRTR